jgi:hypothetical protein
MTEYAAVQGMGKSSPKEGRAAFRRNPHVDEEELSCEAYPVPSDSFGRLRTVGGPVLAVEGARDPRRNPRPRPCASRQRTAQRHACMQGLSLLYRRRDST